MYNIRSISQNKLKCKNDRVKCIAIKANSEPTLLTRFINSCHKNIILNLLAEAQFGQMLLEDFKKQKDISSNFQDGQRRVEFWVWCNCKHYAMRQRERDRERKEPYPIW
jgi:hypothetical protein